VRILVVGAGGREHALVDALARSPQRPELLCAPGNAGIASAARVLDIASDDVEGVVAAVGDEGVDLTVVGPEAPLVAGLVDALAAEGHAAFGPGRDAARLEGSKHFAKAAMDEAGVPTARWRHVTSIEEGMHAARELAPAAEPGAFPGIVVKADGLAAGKGVAVVDTADEAQAALSGILVHRRFGSGSAVVEELLHGEELSLLALCDGERAVAMAPAQDYKRILDGDKGPNTGGMGSYSPVPGVGEERVAEIVRTVHQPIVDLMRSRGTPFHGVLYAGLMLTPDGPRVLEFNVRFGDPETQAVLPRLRGDLVELLLAAIRPGGLATARLDWDPHWAVTVVLASAGYPGSASHGDLITGLDRVGDEVAVTHAGTARNENGELVTAGGRVLGVTALGATAGEARERAYAAADVIDFPGKQMRRDIAARAVQAS
jgi:phosphoribosylamine--glycine ligase